MFRQLSNHSSNALSSTVILKSTLKTPIVPIFTPTLAQFSSLSRKAPFSRIQTSKQNGHFNLIPKFKPHQNQHKKVLSTFSSSPPPPPLFLASAAFVQDSNVTTSVIDQPDNLGNNSLECIAELHIVTVPLTSTTTTNSDSTESIQQPVSKFDQLWSDVKDGLMRFIKFLYPLDSNLVDNRVTQVVIYFVVSLGSLLGFSILSQKPVAKSFCGDALKEFSKKLWYPWAISIHLCGYYTVSMATVFLIADALRIYQTKEPKQEPKHKPQQHKTTSIELNTSRSTSFSFDSNTDSKVSTTVSASLPTVSQ